jgi:prevent-host-death family protein
MTMVMKQVTATTFKAKCLALLDDVEETGEPLVVTKHGKPVARVVPAVEVLSLAGSVTFNVSDDELIEPIDAVWNAAR